MKLQLDTIHFDNILNKTKIYETRIFDKKRKMIKLLDEVIFIDRNSDRTFKAIITELSFYKNFRDAISSVGVKKVLPNVRSLEDGIKLYESIPHNEGGTYKDAAIKYGILRMKFELI